MLPETRAANMAIFISHHLAFHPCAQGQGQVTATHQ